LARNQLNFATIKKTYTFAVLKTKFTTFSNVRSNNQPIVFLTSLMLSGIKKVVFCNDPDTGLRAIIAIHDTTLGPALGSTRMWSYKSEADALNDVLRLSKA
jgi:glutamate dehydrogenase/leucine dehydrogenase